MNRQRIDMVTYLSLFGPAFDWIIQAIVYRSPDSNSAEILQLCKDKKNKYECNYSLSQNVNVNYYFTAGLY